MQDAFQAMHDRCKKSGNEHLLAHWAQLSASQQESLLSQIQSLNFDELVGLYRGHDEAIDWGKLSERAEPPVAIRLRDASPVYSRESAIAAGRKAIAEGLVGMILVAGGQGTRLGFDQPKGLFRIGPISDRTLFEMHVDALRGAMRRYGVSIPLFIMTSPATDAETRNYFAENGNLGLKQDELIIFPQGTMPALDASTGRILLEAPDRIAVSPDGHGGIVAALAKQGCFDFARSKGIKYFFYAQVDNPLVTACDPLLVGYHLMANAQVTTQVVSKRFAKEKVGNVVSIDGRTQIIEYSDLPDHVAEQVLSDGSLKLWAGNIAVHVFDVDFLESASTTAHSLPFHRAKKAVPFIDAHGNLIKPPAPNAIKFERFVFDLLPMAERTIVVEGKASEVFAPVKNADGAPTDTPQATRQALIQLHRSWLEASGVRFVDPEVKVEINPLWAVDEDEVRTKAKGGITLSSDTYFT